MNKINVLILIDKFDYHGSAFNGPQRNYQLLLKYIDKKLFNIHLATVRPKGPSYEVFRKNSIQLNCLGYSKYDIFAFCGIYSFIRIKQIDLLHLQGYGATTFGRIAAAIARKPVIIREAWVDPNISFFQCQIEKFLSRFTTHCIALSNYSKNFLIKKKGMQENKITIIPNGLPVNQFSSVDKICRNRYRESLGIANEDMVVGIIGMLHENKGHRYFIRAAEKIIKENQNTHFVIVGDGELRAELKQLVSDLGLTRVVHFMGLQDKVAEILSMIDIFVSASATESFGTSIIEAMAAQLAIVATQSGGGNELIQNGYNGLVVPAQNSNALANAIIHLINNPGKRRIFSENARAKSYNYDITKVVKNIENLYLNTVAEYKSRRDLMQ